jgi:hypothetical protein
MRGTSLDNRQTLTITYVKLIIARVGVKLDVEVG